MGVESCPLLGVIARTDGVDLLVCLKRYPADNGVARLRVERESDLVPPSSSNPTEQQEKHRANDRSSMIGFGLRHGAIAVFDQIEQIIDLPVVPAVLIYVIVIVA